MADEQAPPIRVAKVADPDDVAGQVEAYLAFVERTTAAMDQVRAADYPGADPEGLATAVVDGQGRVVSVRLCGPAELGARPIGGAVLAALAAAELARQDALVRLAARIQLPEDHSGG